MRPDPHNKKRICILRVCLVGRQPDPDPGPTPPFRSEDIFSLFTSDLGHSEGIISKIFRPLMCGEFSSSQVTDLGSW